MVIKETEVKIVHVPQKLLEKAVMLHGHLGPFLVLGLRMGLLAEKILCEKPQRAEVETINVKPFLCAVDGIKTVMGDNTVTVGEGDGLAAKFSATDGKEVVVKVKKDLVKKYAEVPWERCEEYACEVMRSRDEKLFDS